MEDDWRSAGLSEKRMAMLTYVEKLTLDPGNVSEGDLVALRDAGFSDRDIHDICEATSYYAYVNRIADGLGVTMETWLSEA